MIWLPSAQFVYGWKDLALLGGRDVDAVFESRVVSPCSPSPEDALPDFFATCVCMEQSLCEPPVVEGLEISKYAGWRREK